MDLEGVVAYVPHYIAMLVLVLAAVNLFRVLIPGLPFWGELLVIVVVVILYRPFVTWVGLAPDSWTEGG